MNIFLSIALWFIAAWVLVGALSSIYLVGRPRNPLTPGAVTASVVIATVIVVILISSSVVVASA